MRHGGEIYDLNEEIKYDFSVNLNPVPCPVEITDSLVAAVSDVGKYPDASQKRFRECVANAENICNERAAGKLTYGGPCERDNGFSNDSEACCGDFRDVAFDSNEKFNSKEEHIRLDYRNIIGGSGASELLSGIARTICFCRKAPDISTGKACPGSGCNETNAFIDGKASSGVGLDKTHKVLLPVPSFYGYEHALSMLDSCVIEKYVLLEKNDFLLGDDFVQKITDDTDLIILANPNNPTGKCINNTTFDKIVKKCIETDTYLIVDECFLRLSDNPISAALYLKEYPNIYVVNAYTKLFSIPGARVGYAISTPDNIERLRRFLPEWNLSTFAEKAGIACADILSQEVALSSENVLSGYDAQSIEKAVLIKNTPVVFREPSHNDIAQDSEAILSEWYLRKTDRILTAERIFLTSGFRELGIKVFESDTCFLLIKDQRDLFNLLLEKGILIRDCSNFDGLSKGFYRIAVKDHESNLKLLEALRDIKKSL